MPVGRQLLRGEAGFELHVLEVEGISGTVDAHVFYCSCKRGAQAAHSVTAVSMHPAFSVGILIILKGRSHKQGAHCY